MSTGKPSSEQYDVIVIGSGCGGAAAAALAAFRGQRTLLLEKNPFVGGRSSTIEREGFKLDHGHMISRGGKGPHGALLRAVGCQDLVPEFKPVSDMRYKARFLEREVVFPGGKRPGLIADIKRQMRYRNFTLADLPDVVMFSLQLKVRAMKEKKDWHGADRIDARSFLTELTRNQLIHAGSSAMVSALFGVPYEEASAGEWIRTSQKITGDNCTGYPVSGEGVASIPKAFLRAAERYGAEIVTRAPVENIVLEGGEAAGVSLRGELIRAKRVISNVGIKETAHKLVGSDHFDTAYIEYLQELKYSAAAVSLKYALDEPIVDFDFATKAPNDIDRFMKESRRGAVPSESIMMLLCTSRIDPRLAPPGKQTLVVASPCPAVEPGAVDWSGWVESVKRQVEEDFVPGISKHTRFCLEFTPDAIARESGRMLGDTIGVAQTVDQVGENTPPLRSPIPGLYHVGADVCSRGIGSEKATQSALDLFQQLD